MSKKKDPSSWRGRGETYKNSKREPIVDDNTQAPFSKKKKKKNKKVDHKHEYIPGIYNMSYKTNTGEVKRHQTCGYHCKICGRVRDMRYLWFNTEEKIAQFKKEHPNYVEITPPQGWDYFKDKNVPV